MDITIELSEEESAAVAAMADNQKLSLADVLRIPLNPWLALAVSMYKANREHTDRAANDPQA